ncbi:MAG: hypothetical protein HYV97_15675 [Bdellovibrio sp.]|nr:hypothetical protein [Bdellovibrio sp.]
MKQKTRSRLLSFYFGSIDEKERLLVERELLIDSEYLVEFLDLKRALEEAREIPQYPSNTLWHKLQLQMPSKKKLFLSLGFSLAACIALLTIAFETTWNVEKGKNYPTEVLFDSSSELPASSRVL